MRRLAPLGAGAVVLPVVLLAVRGALATISSRFLRLTERREPLKTCDVKMEDDAPQVARGKGFAFVWMWSKAEAQAAIYGCNGVKVRAGFAEGMVKDKQKKKKERREEKKRTKVVEGDETGGGERAERDNGERIIAVDWALSKDKWEEEKKKVVEKAPEGDEEMDDDRVEKGDEGTSDESVSEDETDGGEDALGLHDGEEGSDDEDEDDGLDEDRSDGEDRVKPQLPPPESGTTLFVRNIPFSATDDELRTL